MNEQAVYYNLASIAQQLRSLTGQAGSLAHNAPALERLADEVEAIGSAILASRKVEVPSADAKDAGPGPDNGRAW